MKNITLLLALVIFTTAFSQKTESLKEFTASNNVTYKVGDEIILGKGSAYNGKFQYIMLTGFASVASATNDAQYTIEQNRLPSTCAGMIVKLKKITKYDWKQYKGVMFTIGIGGPANYAIDIEKAIESCEIAICTPAVQKVEIVGGAPNKYDQLAKLKMLLDDKVLSQEEYDIEKKKILEQ